MKITSIFISFFIFISTCVADSIWSQAASGMYQLPSRRIMLGDVITIYVSETTSAVQQASTSSGKNSQVGGKLINQFDRLSSILGNQRDQQEREMSLQGGDSYQGTGQTARRSSVSAVVSAIVTEILDNGNIYIVGEHKVKVNNDIETIRVSGIVRPSDISPKNTVYSYQIARAEVSVSGRGGPVASKQTPGIATKLFNWIF